MGSSYIANFAAGAFLCNCIPHLTAGLQGYPFPTPFAKPRGIGNSSPPANFLWGFANILVGLWLLTYAPINVGFNLGFSLFALGAVVIGVYLSRHFAAIKRKDP
jgi:hypothetical protein